MKTFKQHVNEQSWNPFSWFRSDKNKSDGPPEPGRNPRSMRGNYRSKAIEASRKQWAKREVARKVTDPDARADAVKRVDLLQKSQDPKEVESVRPSTAREVNPKLTQIATQAAKDRAEAGKPPVPTVKSSPPPKSANKVPPPKASPTQSRLQRAKQALPDKHDRLTAVQTAMGIVPGTLKSVDTGLSKAERKEAARHSARAVKKAQDQVKTDIAQGKKAKPVNPVEIANRQMDAVQSARGVPPPASRSSVASGPTIKASTAQAAEVKSSGPPSPIQAKGPRVSKKATDVYQDRINGGNKSSGPPAPSRPTRGPDVPAPSSARAARSDLARRQQVAKQRADIRTATDQYRKGPPAPSSARAARSDLAAGRTGMPHPIRNPRAAQPAFTHTGAPNYGSGTGKPPGSSSPSVGTSSAQAAPAPARKPIATVNGPSTALARPRATTSPTMRAASRPPVVRQRAPRPHVGTAPKGSSTNQIFARSFGSMSEEAPPVVKESFESFIRNTFLKESHEKK